MAIGEKSNVQKAQEAVLGDGFGPDIKFIYRDLATSPNASDPNSEQAWQVEEYVAGFLRDGWKVLSIDFQPQRRAGNMQDLYNGVWIVLVREPQPAP